MPPLKIFNLIGSLDRGGTEGQLTLLATRLDRTRFTPIVGLMQDGGPLIPVVRAAGVPIEIVPFRGVRASPLTLGKQLSQLVSAIRHHQPDIVHGWLYWGYVLGTLAARLAGIRCIVSSRRGLGIFKENRPAWRLAERLSNRVTVSVVANSEAVREDTAQREGLPRERIRVIRNAVDTRRFGIRRKAWAEILPNLPAGRFPVVAMVANCKQYKDHGTFLRAWENIAARLPNACALLIGDGEERAAIAAEIARRNLGSSAWMLGERGDVPDLLAVADIAVLSSREEGLPNAVLEAMAAGLPVVATDVGGVPELVQDGETGYLVPPGDDEAMADAIAYLAEDADTRAALGASGRFLAEFEFGVERMVMEYQELYRELADRTA